MCKIEKRLFIIITYLFIFFSCLNFNLLAQEKTHGKTKLEGPIKIVGTIKNMAEAKKFLLDTSYVFLFDPTTVNKDNPLLGTFNNGRIDIDPKDKKFIKASNFENNVFTFDLQEILIGSYWIIISPVKGFSVNNVNIGLLANENSSEPLVLDFSKEKQFNSTIQLEKLELLTPKN
jgi:hypothetical protein